MIAGIDDVVLERGLGFTKLIGADNKSRSMGDDCRPSTPFGTIVENARTPFKISISKPLVKLDCC